MAEDLHLNPLTGNRDFDGLIAEFAKLRGEDEMEAARTQIWEKYGVEGAVFISDMASFSSTSRKIGVCHFLKIIHRARQIIAPLIAANNGLLLKCDADNCYAFFERVDDAIQASFDVNAALFAHNEDFGIAEQIYLSVGIDYGRVLLIGDLEFFGDPVNTASKLGEDLVHRLLRVVLVCEKHAGSAERLDDFAAVGCQERRTAAEHRNVQRVAQPAGAAEFRDRLTEPARVTDDPDLPRLQQPARDGDVFRRCPRVVQVGGPQVDRVEPKRRDLRE